MRLDGCRGPWHFILRITVQKLAANIITAIPIFFLGEDSDPSEDPHFPLMNHLWRAVLVILFIAPVFETLLLQAAPIELARALRRSRLVQFLLGSVPFAALHFKISITVGIAGGIVAGAFLSHAYLEGRNRSVWTALWITTMIHFIHNLMAFGVFLFAIWAWSL